MELGATKTLDDNKIFASKKFFYLNLKKFEVNG